MIKIYISGNRADVIEREPLTSGTVGKVLNFAFTEDWRLLIKYAVFEGSGRRIALTNIGDSCIIPHEVLAKHGGALRVGVYGRTADGSAATPTVYAQLGIIQRGADPNADPSTKPTLPVWAQIQAQIGDLSNLTTEDKTNLVAAINEAAKSGGGSGGGKDGTGIESITYKGEDEYGGNMYTVLLTDGTSYDITAPKGAKGDKGDAGGKGDTGVPGKAATIQVGEVTTGAAGTPASVSNVGTDEAAIFDFTIPRGDKGADGADGITPHIGDNGNWYIGDDDTGKPSRGAAGANGKDGAPGKDGAAGSPGITPNIGANGNWYLGTTDTGKPSRGETGLQGPVGKTPIKGTDYWTAADKQEIIDDIHPAYYIDLAGEYPNYTCSVAMADIKAAYNSGYNLVCRCELGVYTATLPLFVPMPAANTWIFSGSGALAAMNFPAQSLTIAIVNGAVQASNTRLASKADIPTIPTALPNPNALTIKVGSTTVTYDGSSAQTVEIADGTEVEY